MHPSQKLQRPEIFPKSPACLFAEAVDISSSQGRNFLFGKLSCEKKKTLAIWQEFFLSFARKLAKQKGFCLRMMKNCQHQHKSKPYSINRKNLKMLQLLWKMQLQIQYTPVELRPLVYVTEEPAEFHAQEAVGFHQEGGEFQ